MREAMAMIDATTVFVVPMFISEGYFTTEVIPRELAFPANQKISTVAGKTIIYTRPSGVHPAMSQLLLKRAYEVAGDTPPEECSLLVVGHGTALNKQSRAAVANRVKKIRESDNRFAEVIDTFMEEAPLISEWESVASKDNVIVVPFFISDGLHSYQDIPVLLGMESEPTAAASQRDVFRHNPHHLRGKTLFYSSAIGTDPSMLDVVLDLVAEAGAGENLPTKPAKPANVPYLIDAIKNGTTGLGQLAINTVADGFELRHIDDADKHTDQLTIYQNASDAREIALYNDAGEYRPLRTSPDLKTGWLLLVKCHHELLHALDYFYPAAVGLSRLYSTNCLKVCHFRDKLGRQTGMYKSARTISDSTANRLINHCCDPQNSCRKHRLWGLTAEKPTDLKRTEPQGAVDLICQEPCNILVAEARKAAKSEVIKIVE